MTIQQSTAMRNAGLDVFETVLGTAPLLRIRSGAQPANCAASRSGTVLVSMTLPSDFMGAASGGVKSKSGTWSASSAAASGDPGHYEFMDSAGSTCHQQGIAAAPWQASRNYSLGAHVTNDSGKLYRCTTAGVAASSGGPTGTSGTISDGAAVWTYVAASAAAVGAIVLGAPVTAGQSVTLDTFELTAANA